MTLFSHRDQETFHSESGAYAESRWVFLNNSQLERVMREFGKATVLEIGYGTGLNFLLTAELANRCGTSLDYCGIESCLLQAELLEQLDHGRWLNPVYAGIVEEWIAWHKHLDANRAAFADSSEQEQKRQFLKTIQLRLILDNACTWMLPRDSMFDAVYLDAFSPRANAPLWTREFFEKLFRGLKTGGRLVTYCSQSAVQKRLAEAGFQVEKTPGPPGGKREVLVAIKK